MTKKLSEKFVRRSAIEQLRRMRYSRDLREKETHEHGTDFQVRHNDYPVYYVVEAKGDPTNTKHVDSVRESYFISALGQILTRVKNLYNHNYAIALPESYSKKVFRRLSWIALKKVGLTIFLVNEKGKVRKITWKELKNFKNNN